MFCKKNDFPKYKKRLLTGFISQNVTKFHDTKIYEISICFSKFSSEFAAIYVKLKQL